MLIVSRQKWCPVTNYTIDFHILVSESTWNNEALMDKYVQMLVYKIKDELANHDLGTIKEIMIKGIPKARCSLKGTTAPLPISSWMQATIIVAVCSYSLTVFVDSGADMEFMDEHFICNLII